MGADIATIGHRAQKSRLQHHDQSQNEDNDVFADSFHSVPPETVFFSVAYPVGEIHEKFCALFRDRIVTCQQSVQHSIIATETAELSCFFRRQP